jgi:LPXTG-motif cell wall-anchored protein
VAGPAVTQTVTETVGTATVTETLPGSTSTVTDTQTVTKTVGTATVTDTATATTTETVTATKTVLVGGAEAAGNGLAHTGESGSGPFTINSGGGAESNVSGALLVGLASLLSLLAGLIVFLRRRQH